MSGPVSFGGLLSGLNTSQIINAQMAIFQYPLQVLQSRQAMLNTQISDYQTINSGLLAMKQAGDALSNPLAFAQAFSVGSSNSFAATGAITSGSQAGSITFAVNQLATGSTQISAGTVSATSNVVASGNYLVGSGGAAIGVASFGGQAALLAGAHTISVTQASTGATVAGSTALAGSTSITSANNTIDVSVDGVASTLTIATGNYTPTQLTQAITQASGGTLNASVGAGGALSIATAHQGSTASLQITGGSALATVGLATSPIVAGTDGIINVDGTATTVTSIAATGTTQVVLASGSGGSITANLSGSLNLGSMSAQNVSVGNGSLASVVNAINGANVGVSATALQVGTNQYVLEITSLKTGLTGAATIDTQAFSTSSLGIMQTTTAAQNSIISVGGVGGLQVVSSANTVTGLLPGLTATLSQVSATPVTLTIAPDGSKMASQVSALVDAANKILSFISTETAYNPATRVAGPLNGQTSIGALAQRILSVVGNAIGTSAAGSSGTPGESAGLAITSTGTITFNESAFVSAYNANPTAVRSMFTVGGTFSPANAAYAGQVSVVGATDMTTPGSYAVSISQSASQALDVGSAAFAATTSTLAAAETYTITSGTSTVTYTIGAGQSIAAVASGINAALAAAGIGASASLTGVPGSYQMQLTSADYGSTATFTVGASGTDQLGLLTSGATYTGIDVAGTINGQAATGSGQMLSLANQADPANGLFLQVGTPGIVTATSLGTVNYNPGFAQSLANVAYQVTASPGGQIPATITGLTNTLANVMNEIVQRKQLISIQQEMLTREFVNMERVLARLTSESKFLSLSSAAATSTSLFSSGSTLSIG
ncbi:MAG TPA: flagellar filament capping protein FliD [Candidatus Paceibacterota bacterium]|nr:flagellar filament capping protein FliD [Candidatus Paceibacterota bacterium]